MKEKKLWAHIAFALLLPFPAFIIGGYLGSLAVSTADGMAGGAIVAMYALMGAVIGLIIGIVLPKFLTKKVLIRTNVILLLVSLAGYGVLAYRYQRQQAEEQEEQLPVSTKPTAPTDNADTFHLMSYTHDTPTVQLPVGLGVAAPLTESGKTLYLYNKPQFDQLPDMIKPIDSITFHKKPPHISIATAPAYLVPQDLKMDYQIFFFRVVSIDRYWVEVIVNHVTGQTIFLDRSAVTYQGWPEFLLNVYDVERLDVEINPVRYKPLDHTSVFATGPNIGLKVLAVDGDWLKVSTNGLADRIPPIGYIRWRDGNGLVIRYSLLS